MKRLFLAIALPDAIAAVLNKFNEEITGFRWVKPENYHITLKFIGDADPGLEEKIVSSMSKIQVRSFILSLEGVGCFPQKGHPQVIWADLGKGHPHLFQLQGKIEDILFGLGLDPGSRAWHPHITLARCSESSADVAKQFVKRYQNFEGPPFRVNEFILCSSDLRSGASQYTVEHSWILDNA